MAKITGRWLDLGKLKSGPNADEVAFVKSGGLTTPHPLGAADDEVRTKTLERLVRLTLRDHKQQYEKLHADHMCGVDASEPSLLFILQTLLPFTEFCPVYGVLAHVVDRRIPNVETVGSGVGGASGDKT